MCIAGTIVGYGYGKGDGVTCVGCRVAHGLGQLQIGCRVRSGDGSVIVVARAVIRGRGGVVLIDSGDLSWIGVVPTALDYGIE